VEEGYGERSMVYDYASQLHRRDLLEDYLIAAPEALKRKVEDALTPLDTRFKDVTRPDDADRIGEYYEHGTGWWWWRLPLKMSGSLAEDLGPT
jgi:hypothetical protein